MSMVRGVVKEGRERGLPLRSGLASPRLARMRNSLPIRLGISLLCLCVAATGCRVAQPTQVRTAGLVVDVLRARNTKRGVEVTGKIFNEHEMKVVFDLGDVRLLCGNGIEFSPDSPQRGAKQTVELRPKYPNEFRWVFPVKEPLLTGTYTIEIKSLLEVDVQLPNKAEFPINIP